MIRFENITKEFANGKTALNEVSFHIEPGEFLFITGPSGAGKTTILRLLIREITPSKGEIYWEGKKISSIKKKHLAELRRQIGAIFQDYKLIDDRTVEENVSLISEMIHSSQEEVKKHTEEILALVDLSDKSELFPSQISGGELQRTAIARALATNPKIIFADEPTGNLDQGTAWDIINLLLKINKQGATVIVSSHNQEFVNSLKKRIVELKDGRIIKDTKKPKKTKTKEEEKDKESSPEKNKEKTKESKKDQETATKKTQKVETKKDDKQVSKKETEEK